MGNAQGIEQEQASELQGLLTTEHQRVVAVPDAARVGILPADHRTVMVAFDVEHVQLATGARSGLADNCPELAPRLVGVSQAKLQGSLVRAFAETELVELGVDRIHPGAVRETQFGDGAGEQLELALLLPDGGEVLVPDYAIGPLREFVTRSFDGCFERILVLVGSDRNRLPHW